MFRRGFVYNNALDARDAGPNLLLRGPAPRSFKTIQQVCLMLGDVLPARGEPIGAGSIQQRATSDTGRCPPASVSERFQSAAGIRFGRADAPNRVSRAPAWLMFGFEMLLARSAWQPAPERCRERGRAHPGCEPSCRRPADEPGGEPDAMAR